MFKKIRSAIILTTIVSAATATSFDLTKVNTKYRTILEGNNFYIIEKQTPFKVHKDFKALPALVGDTNNTRTTNFLKKFAILDKSNTKEYPILKYVKVENDKLTVDTTKTSNKKDALVKELLEQFTNAIPDPKFLSSWRKVIDLVKSGDIVSVVYDGTTVELKGKYFEEEEEASPTIPMNKKKETHTFKGDGFTIEGLKEDYKNIVEVIQANDELVDAIKVKYIENNVEYQKTIEQLHNLGLKAQTTQEELKNMMKAQEAPAPQPPAHQEDDPIEQENPNGERNPDAGV